MILTLCHPPQMFLMTVAFLGAAADMLPAQTFTAYNAARGSNMAPMQVQDTYEVAAAKRTFERQYQELARQAAEAPDTHQYVQEQPRTTYSHTPAVAPVQVQDTYEVAAAKRAFERQYQELARQAAEAPDTHQYVQEQPRTTYSHTPAVAPVQVQDTYEVAAAKRDFERQYQELARQAAEAPDTHQYVQEQPRTTYSHAPAVAPVQVQDTYEVAAAKRAFQQEFDRRAAMAASSSYN